MTVKEFLELYCEEALQVEISDSWYVDEETFNLNKPVKNHLRGPNNILEMKVKSIDVGSDYLLFILVEKE